MKATELNELKKLLKTKQNIVIVTHWSPDGDAIGSSLGLYNFLKKLKHSVTVITPNDYPSFLTWMPGNKNILIFNQQTAKATKVLAKAKLIFCLDFNSLKRIDKLGDEVGKSKAKKMIIDHHLQPEKFANYMLHDTKASSTCELVFDFINLLGYKKLITKDIASCLYAGIMTDTGSFRFPSTTPKVHRVVADLIECGANNAEIYNSILDDNTADRLKLLGFCLSDKMNVFPEYKAAYISLTEDELKRFNYQKGDTEGTVNQPLSIRGIRFAAFFAERDGKIKASFRSKGNFDVNVFARKHFNGGGHANAAGGESGLTMDETIQKFVGLLPEYSAQLNRKK